MKLIPSFLLALPLLMAVAAAADLAPARALLAKKDFPAAIAVLEPITAAEPTNAEAHLALGNALSGRIDKVGLMSKAGLAKRSLAAYERAAALVGGHALSPTTLGGEKGAPKP